MSTKLHAQAKTKSTLTPFFTPARPGLLQHKRAFVSTPGLTDEFADSRRKMLVSQPSLIQTKLTIGQPNDRYEQEADRVTEQVMRMPGPRVHQRTKPVAGQTAPLIQRQEEDEENLPEREEYEEKFKKDEDEEYEDTNKLLPKELPGQTPKVSPDLQDSINALRGGGQPLDPSTRAFMEPHFGRDFSQVRIHTDSQAAETARAVNACAFTVGRDVVFGAGQYAPGTAEGKRLLAHELTHVVQQGNSQRGLQGVIQRWSITDHKELTRKGLENWASRRRFKLDKKMKEKLADESAHMDLRIPELAFNAGGYFRGLYFKLKKRIFKLSKKRIKELEEEQQTKLKLYYLKNSYRAEHHGEGGLYHFDKSYAKTINVNQQKRYVDRAKAFYELDAENEALSALGDALHIAQDRGAHGEGAKGEGHSKEIEKYPDVFHPDDRNSNSRGYKNAGVNTKMLLLSASDILKKVLKKRLSGSLHVLPTYEYVVPTYEYVVPTYEYWWNKP